MQEPRYITCTLHCTLPNVVITVLVAVFRAMSVCHPSAFHVVGILAGGGVGGRGVGNGSGERGRGKWESLRNLESCSIFQYTQHVGVLFDILCNLTQLFSVTLLWKDHTLRTSHISTIKKLNPIRKFTCFAIYIY